MWIAVCERCGRKVIVETKEASSNDEAIKIAKRKHKCDHGALIVHAFHKNDYQVKIALSSLKIFL